ncbi:MAG TPA: methyltransferase [Bacteroidia bacterium]|jgi:protein-S-isoprenylcysteine O-methyltransferase Ste14|nr:methyltransferase [Bacteroidia bacterium]
MSIPKIIFTLFYILLYPVLLLFLSGDWFWVEGWIFSIWFTILCFTTIIYLYRNNPALLAERYRKPGTGGQKGWDTYVVYGLALGFFIWIVTMPLDAKRFGWSGHFPVFIKIAGGFGLVLSFIFFFRSFADNSFLSPLVRIQEERKQKVITTGVYAFVRHPMYFAATMLFIGTPMLLGSLYGILVGFLLVLLLAFRILGEEKLLEKELEGYTEYKQKVKYRLMPFIW